MSIVSEKNSGYLSNDNRVKELLNENEHLKQKLIDKEQFIAMQQDFIENLKRQIK